MDRRYNQARFYDGTRASDGRQEQSEALVRRYLGRARQLDAVSQSYGGSTGGSQSGQSNQGLFHCKFLQGLTRARIREADAFRDPEPTSICGSWVYCTRRIGDFQEFGATKRFFVASMQQTRPNPSETLWLTLSFVNFYHWNQRLRHFSEGSG